MKYTLFLLLAVVVLGSALAGRRNKHKNRDGAGECSRFVRKPVAMTECIDGFMNVTVARHPKSPTTCPEFKTYSKPCRPPFCKYNKRTRNVGACDPDTNTETVSESLKKAVGRIECDPTRSYVRPCKMIGDCIYKDMYNYTRCDNSTGQATGSLKLKKQTGTDECEPQKMVKLPCDVAAERMQKMAEWREKKQQKRNEKKQKRKEAKKARKAQKKERKANRRQGRRFGGKF